MEINDFSWFMDFFELQDKQKERKKYECSLCVDPLWIGLRIAKIIVK